MNKRNIYRFLIFVLFFIPLFILGMIYFTCIHEYNVHMPKSEIDKNRMISSLDIYMVYIKSGSFIMGSKNDQFSMPLHKENVIQSYWLSKYEITQKQYQEIMGSNPSKLKNELFPVHCVSWFDALKFCKKLNDREMRKGRIPKGYVYRLPTEVEWEYAAKGGAYSLGYKYGASRFANLAGWFVDNSNGQIHEIGLKKANELGLCDMTGNVREWCVDIYHKRNDIMGLYPGNIIMGESIVLKGGGWGDSKNYMTPGSRLSNSPYGTHMTLGFRLCLGPKLNIWKHIITIKKEHFDREIKHFKKILIPLDYFSKEGIDLNEEEAQVLVKDNQDNIKSKKTTIKTDIKMNSKE